MPSTRYRDPFDARTVDLRWLGARLYMVLAQVVYVGARDTFTVKPGFITDLTTTPRFAEWLIPRDGAWLLAALIHDLLCVELWKSWRQGRVPAVSSRDADGILLRIMRELDEVARARGDRKGRINPLHRHLIWCAVRSAALVSRNPVRREGAWRDAPLVLLTGLLVSPVILPAAVLICVGMFVDALVRAVADLASGTTDPQAERTVHDKRRPTGE